MRLLALLPDEDFAGKSNIFRQLHLKGCIVERHNRPKPFLAAFRERPYDMALLDATMLPGPALDAVEAILDRQPDLVLVILAPSPSLVDRLSWLHAGAAAYLERPVDPEELYLRLMSLLRRFCRWDPDGIHVAGDLRLDQGTGVVERCGWPVPTTAGERRLLRSLMLNEGTVMTSALLADEIEAPGYRPNAGSTRALARGLMRKLNGTLPVLFEVSPCVFIFLSQCALPSPSPPSSMPSPSTSIV